MTGGIQELYFFVRTQLILIIFRSANIAISVFVGVDLIVCFNGVVDDIFFLYITFYFFESALKFLLCDLDFDSCFERCAFFVAGHAKDTFHFLEIVLATGFDS